MSDKGPQFISRVWTCVPRASFVFHLETKVLESGGRVEKLIQLNSIQDYLYSAFYDTIGAKQLHMKLCF